jgi:hypothetical protein
MSRIDFFKRIIGWSLAFILLIGVLAPTAEAGRYVLNQTPQTIKSYFGAPAKQILTAKGITYVYSPAGFRRLFPEYSKSVFNVNFVKNRVQNIILETDFSKKSPDFMNDIKVNFYKFYNYIFGYKPSVWKQLSSKFSGNETIYDYEYCLGDGVATQFSMGGADQNVLGGAATFYYDTRCEPPY